MTEITTRQHDTALKAKQKTSNTHKNVNDRPSLENHNLIAMQIRVFFLTLQRSYI